MDPVKPQAGLVKPRPDLKEFREKRGVTLNELHRDTDLHKATIGKIESGKLVSVASLTIYARYFGLQFDQVCDQEILPPLEPHMVRSWIVRKISPVQTAANGLQWQVCELEHKHLPTSPSPGTGLPKEKARGKLYNLSAFVENAVEWKRKTSYLLRHGDVVARVKSHPNIARFIDAFQDENDKRLWWVLEEWIEGSTTLLERLENEGPLRGKELIRCMKGIAEGLGALHQKGIVRRELTPRSILISKDRIVMTDFELAKLLDGSPTVRPANVTWPHQRYIAPEASYSPTDNERHEFVTGAASWDLYSWAVILAHAYTGQCPSTFGKVQEILGGRDIDLPDPLTRFALRCLQPQLARKESDRRPSKFPADLDALLALE